MSNGISYGKLFTEIIDSDISNLLEYHELIEMTLMEKVGEVSSQYQELKDSDDIDPSSEYFYVLQDIYAEKHQKFSRYFPQNLRASLLTQSHSLLEYHLNKICDFIEHTHQFSFSVKDIRGSNLERSQLYLSKKMKISFGNYNPEWEFIMKMRKVRNVFIHVDGNFPGSNNKIVEIVKDRKMPPLSVRDGESDIKPEDIDASDTYKLIIPDDKLNKAFLNKINGFFKKLCADITWIQN